MSQSGPSPFTDESYEQNKQLNPYLLESKQQKSVKQVSGKKKGLDQSFPSSDLNNNMAMRQGRSSFNGNNSISGLVNGRSVSQCFTSSLDPGNTSNMSHEAIQNTHGRPRNET